MGAVTLMLGVQRILSRLPTAAAARGNNNANRSVASLLLGRLARSDSATCGGSLIAAGIVTLTTLTLSRNVAAPALRGARVSSMASSSSDDAAREKELQGLWANAYDGWIDVPGEAGVVVYTKPVATPGDPAPTPFPHIVASSRLFALTGFNPMGEDRPIGENRAANEKLVLDIQAMTPAPKAWWRAFGFAHDWREDGFVVAFHEADAAEARAAIVELAVKYDQGAVYEYAPKPDDATRLTRKTVPAAMSAGVEADAALERCGKPELALANREVEDDAYDA